MKTPVSGCVRNEIALKLKVPLIVRPRVGHLCPEEISRFLFFEEGR